jgi:hypothetical protein
LVKSIHAVEVDLLVLVDVQVRQGDLQLDVLMLLQKEELPLVEHLLVEHPLVEHLLVERPPVEHLLVEHPLVGHPPEEHLQEAAQHVEHLAVKRRQEDVVAQQAVELLVDQAEVVQ